MIRSPRAVSRLLAAGGALLLAGLPLGTRADNTWSSTLTGVATLSYTAGQGLNLSPLACSGSAGTFTVTMNVSFVTTTVQYAGPASISALFTSTPGDCSTIVSDFGSLSNATMSGVNALGDTITCDLSLGGYADIPGNLSGYAIWDFFGPGNGPVPCSIDGQPAGSFGVGMEGQTVITGVSASSLQATEVQIPGALSFGS